MTTEITVTVPEWARGDAVTGAHDDTSMCWVQDLPAGVALIVEEKPRGHAPKEVARVSEPDADGRRTVQWLSGDEAGVVTLSNRSIGTYAAWSWTGAGYELSGSSWAYLIGAVAAILGRPAQLHAHHRWQR